jgi:hypothetical protein
MGGGSSGFRSAAAVKLDLLCSRVIDRSNRLTFFFAHGEFASAGVLSDDEVAVQAVGPEVSRVFPHFHGERGRWR